MALALSRLRENARLIPRPEWRASYLNNVRDHARTLQLADAWLGSA